MLVGKARRAGSTASAATIWDGESIWWVLGVGVAGAELLAGWGSICYILSRIQWQYCMHEKLEESTNFNRKAAPRKIIIKGSNLLPIDDRLVDYVLAVTISNLEEQYDITILPLWKT